MTRTGDQGQTGLGDGKRVSKDHPRVEAFGTVDELNASLGLIIAYPLPENLHNILSRVQNELFDLGGELSVPGMLAIKETYIQQLENEIELLNKDLPYLKEFILPGGHPAAAMCHLARTICRRAERRVVTLMQVETINPQVLIYLNRLSDLLFIVSRVINHAFAHPEIQWKHERNKQ